MVGRNLVLRNLVSSDSAPSHANPQVENDLISAWDCLEADLNLESGVVAVRKVRSSDAVLAAPPSLQGEVDGILTICKTCMKDNLLASRTSIARAPWRRLS